MSVLYKADPIRGEIWKDIFARHHPDMPLYVWPETGPLEEIDYVVAWTAPSFPFTALPRLKAIFSVGAGVNQFDMAAIPDHVPLVRLVDPYTTQSLAEYVTMGVLALHRDLPAYIAQQIGQTWQPHPAVTAANRRIGFMGLGEMARAAIARLAPLGFPVSGWSRSRKALAGVTCHAGTAELGDFLAATDILVCLLPLTEETAGILNADLFARLPQGAALLQAGRGEHLVEDDLVVALDAGRLRAAMLDVARPEPLPPDNALWRHPHILITPHIASQTSPVSAAQIVLANIDRLERGERPDGLVDRRRGY